MALLGMDASRHQGTIDWHAVRAGGLHFAFIKATDSISYKYIWWFHTNLPEVKEAGLIPGAYHFLVDHQPGAAQARYYVQEVTLAGGFNGIVPVLDVEREQDGTGPRIGTVREFVDEFRRLVPGRPIVIYTGHWYWVGVIGNPHGADLGPLWHSEYETTDLEIADGPELDRYGGWSGATFWQYTSSGQCPGVVGNCDLNLFYGTHADLAALAGLQEDTLSVEEVAAINAHTTAEINRVMAELTTSTGGRLGDIWTAVHHEADDARPFFARDLNVADSPTFVLFKPAGVAMWVATDAEFQVWWLDRVYADERSGTPKPWHRDTAHIRQYTLVGPVPPGWETAEPGLSDGNG